MDQATLYIILAGVFGVFMAWGVGANDVANAMGTSVGSRALSIGQAIAVAAVFEFAGAVLAGGQVTATIRKSIVDSSLLAGTPELLVFGMLAALLAAGSWLLIATRFGWPVSTTHSIVGAVVGFAVADFGLDSVQWGKVLSIVLSWVISPLLAGAIAFTLFTSVQRLVFDSRDPFRAAKLWVPVYIFLTAFVIALVTLLKGLKHVGLHVSIAQSYAWAALAGLAVAGAGALATRRIRLEPGADRGFHYTNVERVFAVLMMVTACAMAFAHGSNDVANAIGPVAAVVSTAQSGEVAQSARLPLWILMLGGAGIVAGLLTWGHRVIATVGSRITELTPSRGFAATLAAAATVVLASGTGLPISTTHTLVGAVLGVGIARGIAAINMQVVRAIFMSWIVTLPAGALLAVLFYYLLLLLLG